VRDQVTSHGLPLGARARRQIRFTPLQTALQSRQRRPRRGEFLSRNRSKLRVGRDMGREAGIPARLPERLDVVGHGPDRTRHPVAQCGRLPHLGEHGQPAPVDLDGVPAQRRPDQAELRSEVIVDRGVVPLTGRDADLSRRHRMDAMFCEQPLGRIEQRFSRPTASAVGSGST
jgi:hypothetical protein